MNRWVAGVISGAVGTLALNAATFADMAVRGRPTSAVPDQAIARTARQLGAESLAGTGEAARNRRQGLGSRSGAATGVATGVIYALVRPGRRLTAVTEALVVGAVAMVTGNAGAVVSGATDPRRWTASDWVADLVPHVCYGLAAVPTLRVLAEARRP